MPKDVSDFRLKLELLLRGHPEIRTRKALAQELDLSDASQITKWQGGDSYAREGKIPLPHFERICALFDIDPAWLDSERRSGETRLEYELRLQAALGARDTLSSWRRVLDRAVDSDGLWLHALDCAPSRRRGLLYPSSAKDGETIVHPGDRVYVELQLDPGAGAFLVLLSINDMNTRCLCPSASEMAPPHQVEGPSVRIPVTAPETHLVVDEALGPQSLIAIVASEAMPRSLQSQLVSEGATAAVLQQLAVTLMSRPPATWRCLRRRYQVTRREAS